MRVFESDQFRDDYVEGINGVGYEYPDEETREALKYVGQFVQRGSHELLKGYMPDKYADALVRLRDANSSRKLTNATKALCVDGDVSHQASLSDLVRVDVPNSFDMVQQLDDEYDSAEDSESKTMIRNAQEIIRTNRGDFVELWLPQQVVSSVETFQDYS